RVDYGAVDDWESTTARRLGQVIPKASSDEAFKDVFAALQRSLPRFPHGHDADPALARAIWQIARGSRPRKVVETGVARGVSSRYVLEAFERNGAGHLWSIDLPPLIAGFHGQVGRAVPHDLRERWTYIRGPSRRALPKLLRRIAPIDFFIQDSVGTPPTVLHELTSAWDALAPGGWMVANAVNRSEAFREFLEERAPTWYVVASADAKARLSSAAGSVVGQFAIVSK